MGSDDEANRTNILLHKNIILYPSRYQKQHPSAQPSPNDHTDPLIISWVSSEGLGAGVGSPNTIIPDFSGHLGACSQYGTYDFLETSSICPSHVFRRAYKGSRQTNVWLQNNSS